MVLPTKIRHFSFNFAKVLRRAVYVLYIFFMIKLGLITKSKV